jgi:hypothetical protein
MTFIINKIFFFVVKHKMSIFVTSVSQEYIVNDRKEDISNFINLSATIYSFVRSKKWSG